MLELLVTGPDPTKQWRREIPSGETIRIGRAPRNGWAVSWDPLISREHCELSLEGRKLRVTRLDSARNPVYFENRDERTFVLQAGQGFRVGQTNFQLVAVEEQTFLRGDLRQFQFHNAEQRLAVLAGLPEAMAAAKTAEDLAQAAVQILLAAIPYAQLAACVQYPPNPQPAVAPLLIRWASRGELPAGHDLAGAHDGFTPSRRLMTSALRSDQGILHVWRDLDATNEHFTMSGTLDWAYCIPLAGEATRGWALYVTGYLGSPGASAVKVSDLRGDLRFTELIADFIGSFWQVRQLEQQQARLTQFLSPAVVEVVRRSNAATALEPREGEITVLFCDVRGFTTRGNRRRHATISANFSSG